MSYSGGKNEDGGSESSYDRRYASPSTAAPTQLLSPMQAQSTRYSASLSEDTHSLIASLEEDDDSIASVDVQRVGFTPRSSVALTDTDAEDDPNALANQSIDEERDVEHLLLDDPTQEHTGRHGEQDGTGSEQRYSEQYGSEDMFSEDDFDMSHPPEWSHVLSVEEVRNRRTKKLSTVAEVRSSIGSQSQLSRGQMSPGAFPEDIPPVPAIPSMYRHQRAATEDDTSPQHSLRSFHSRNSTDPGVVPAWSGSNRSSSSLGVRDRIAFFEDRSASPALAHGVRPGSPGGTHGLGLGLGLSRSPAPGSIFSPGRSSMLSTPFSPAQSMPNISPVRPDETSPAYARPTSYHSTMSSSASGPRSRPSSPIKTLSVKSYHSSEGSSVHNPSFLSSPPVVPLSQPTQNVSSENVGMRATSALIQSVSEDLLRTHQQHQQQQQTPEQGVHRPQLGYVQRILQSYGPEEGSGLFDIRRRRASAGHEKPSSQGHGSDGSRSAEEASQSAHSNGSRRVHSEGSHGSIEEERSAGQGDLAPMPPNSEEPLRIGSLWYLHVHTGDERFRWIKCKAVLFRSQLQLTWVEAGGGKAIIGLDLLNCHEVRSVPSPSHTSAWDDIGNVAARAQALEEGPDSRIGELCPFQMLYEDGVERLGAGSPRERVRWVAAIWDALNRASIPSRSTSPVHSVGTIPSQRSSQRSGGTSSGSRNGSASTVFIPADEDIPDIGSTISSLTRSSFHSGSRTSSSSYQTGTRPRSLDDTSIVSHGDDLLSPSDPRIAIAPSRSSSLRRTASMTDLDEYASVVSETHPRSGVPLTSSRIASSVGSQGFPQTIHSPVSSRSSSGRPLPDVPPLSSIPSMPSLRSERSSEPVRRPLPTSTETTSDKHERGFSAVEARQRDASTDIGRYETASGSLHSRSVDTVTPVVPLRPTHALPSKSSDRGSSISTSSFLTAPGFSAPRSGSFYTPSDAGPVRRIRAGKASSVYSLTSVNEQERHRSAAEDASTVDEYGSVLSSPVPSTSSIGTPGLFPRLGFLGTDSASMLGDSHVGGGPGDSGSASSETGTGRSFNAPRAPSKLAKVIETPTGTSATSLVRSLPGARPRATRFPPSRSSTTSGSYVTPDEKENVPDSSSESYVTASERTPGKIHRQGPPGSSGPLSVAQENTQPEDEQETEGPLTEIMSVQTNSSHGDEDPFDSHRSRLTRADSYYTSTSAGLARSRSIAGDSTYSTIAYDVCMSSDMSEITPLSGSSTERTPTPQPSPLTISSPYVSAPESVTPVSSIGSIPTLLSESAYATAERVDTSSEYSTAIRWPSSTEYSTVPLASSAHQSPTPSSKPSVSVAPIPTPSQISPTPRSTRSPSIVQARSSSHHSPSPASSKPASIPQLATPSQRSATPSSSRSISVPRLPTPGGHSLLFSRSASVESALRTPTPSVIGTIPDAMSEVAPTSEDPSSESSVTPTQSRTMSLASRSVTSSPMSSPRKASSSRSSVIQSSISRLPQSTSVSSVSSMSSTSVSSVTASPLPTPMSTSSRSLSSVTTSLRTPNSFLMPPVPPPSSTRSTRTRPVSEASYAPSSSGQSMSSSQFDYTPSAISVGLPPIEEDFDSSVFGPSVGSTDVGHYEVVLVDSSDGVSSIESSTRSTSIPAQSTHSIASTPSAFRDTFSASSLTRSESVSSVSSLRSSIFLPSRSSSIRSVMPPPSESDAYTPRSPTVSVTMTPAQSFHPSFRDDLSTVPSEEEQALATASAPMEIITHDVNRLLEYLDGVDRQRVAEHEDVKDQLDRVEDELKKLADFVRKEAEKSPRQAIRSPPLPESTEDVVMHHPPKPAVILLDPPESPIRLSSGSVTESVEWLSSPSSISEGLPIPFQESSRAPSSIQPSSITKSGFLHPSGAPSEHSLGPLDSISQRSEVLARSGSPSDRSIPLELSRSEASIAFKSSESGSQSASLRPSDSASQRSASIGPPDSASRLSVSQHLSTSERSSSPLSVESSLPVDKSVTGLQSPSSSGTIHDTISVSSEQDTGTPESTNILLAPPPSAGSTPPASVPSASPARTPLSTPPRTRGNTPDIDIVSASGRTSPARSDITIRQAVSNAQLRDMLHDLRQQTDKLMEQQNKANDAIEELQNRPPIQLPSLPTPRRSPYADLLSQIADTLRNIVEAGEAARELESETGTETESIAETEDTGATLQLNNLQNRLHDVLGMPAPPQPVVSLSTVRPRSSKSPTPSESLSRSSPPPVSLFEQHIAEYPRIRRPIPRRSRLVRSPSPRVIERPGTAPVPSAPMWGRARPIVATTRTPPPPVRVESESSPTQVYQRPLSEIVEDSGPDLDLLKLLQERRRQRRGGDGTYIPGANEPVEEILEIPPRPDSAPIDYGLQDEPITKTWYQDRPSRARPENLMADPMHDGASESPTPRRTPILIPREPPSSRPTIPLGELPSTASYAEMLALLRQNELMQRHQTEQQNELVRYLHDLNGWLARDVNNRQLELQGVEDRITHLQNALGNRVAPPYPVTYVAEQEPVIPLQSHAPQRFGDPDDFVIPPSRMGRLPPPMAYGQPPLGAFAPYPRTMFGEPASPPIIPTAPSMMPIIEVRGMAPPSRSRPTFKSPSPDQGRSHRAESAHVLDPTRRGSPQLPPPSAQPNIINVNIPPSHMHGTSHSPSRRRREGSRSPSPQIIHTTSHRRTQSPPTIIHDDRMSRRARSHRDGEPVIVMGEGSRRGERRSESGSRSPSPIILTGPSGSSRPRSSRRRRPQMVVVGDGGGGRSRSGSRSPPSPIILSGAPRSSRRHSPQRTVIVGEGGHRSRGRSRSRTPSPVIIAGAPSSPRRSRSERRTVVVQEPGRSRRSYSRSPERTVYVPASSRRSRSPRIIMEPRERSRSRSRSRERNRLIRAHSRRSRSRSPIIIAPTRRTRSKSPQRVIVAGSSGHSGRDSQPIVIQSEPRESTQPIIIEGEGRASRRGFMDRLFGRRTRSPTRIIQTGSARSRSPTRVIHTEGSRRSRSPPVIYTTSRRSRSPRHVLGKERHRSPVIIEADRPRSRSPRRIHHSSRRSRSPPPVILTGSTRRSRSRSRSRSPRRRSRSPVQIIQRSRRGYSRSPRRSDRRSWSGSPRRRYDTVDYDANRRRHRSYERRSPSPRRDSRSPERRSRSLSRRGGSRYTPSRRDRDDRYGEGSRYGEDRPATRRPITRRASPDEYDGPRSRSPTDSRSRHRVLERHGDSRRYPDEYDPGRRGRPDSSRRLTQVPSPSRTQFTRRSRSRSRSVSPAGTRAPRTHHSELLSPRLTVLVPEEEPFTPISRPGTRRPQELSTIHEGESVRTGSPPSVIQVPGGRHHQAKSTLRVASPGPSIAPSIIQLPTGELARRATPQMLRIGTPRAETPAAAATVIRVPSAPPVSQRPQLLRIGTPRTFDQSPTMPETRHRSVTPPQPTLIRLPTPSQEPHRTQMIRVGGTPLPYQTVTTPRPSSGQAGLGPSVIQLPGQPQDVRRMQTIRVGTPGQPTMVPEIRRRSRTPPQTAFIRLPTPSREPHRARTIRVGGVPASPQQVVHAAPVPLSPPGVSVIQLPGGLSLGPQTVRVASPTSSEPRILEQSVIRLPEQTPSQLPIRPQTVKVTSPPPAPIPPSVIRLRDRQELPERPPTSQVVRVGGQAQPPVTPTPLVSAYVPPAEQIIRLPGSPTPVVSSPPAFVRVAGQTPGPAQRALDTLPPPPTMIQLPGDHARPLKSPMVRVTAPSTATPSVLPSTAPLPHVIQLPGTPGPSGTMQSFVRVAEGASGTLTSLPGRVGSPGVVRVEHRDRTPTVIQVASPGPGSRFVRATPSPSANIPGFVRSRGAAVTPGLSMVPEIVRVGQHTPIPGASRASMEEPSSARHSAAQRPLSILSVGGGEIFAPVASRSSVTGRSIAENLNEMVREAEEEAEQRRRRRQAGGIPADAFAIFEDRESKRQRQFEEFLEAQRAENERLRETLVKMVPGYRRSSPMDPQDPEAAGQIGRLVSEAVDTIKSHRESDRASILSIRDDEMRRDLENERARVQELEAELANLREQLDEERSRKSIEVQDKCAEMRDAMGAQHDEIRAHLGELTNRMVECRDENARRIEQDEQRWSEKEARRARKEDQQQQLQDLLAKMMADQEEDRRIAEEERRKAAEKPGLEDIIAQLRQQNAEQQQLLVTLLDEYRNASAQQSSETIEAVRAAVAQHVPMDIKGHLNEFSKSLAEEVRLLLREVGKLREEKRNIQYEIGCMLCLKSKYGPGGEFDPEWRPPTGPYANGPPMPEGPAEGAAPAAEEQRPTTAQPAWRTIQQKRKPGRKREQPVPQQQPQMQPQPPTPMPMPVPAASSVPPPAPMPVPMQTATFTATGPPPSAMPPPSVMDQSRQQSWYAWQPDPRYVPSSPSSAPMYEVPDTRPLGFFGPRSPRDFNF